MAIKPTPNNNMFKSLVFDGVDSRDYGIYITGDAVFNSPERDVEMIEIPGRNGAYALDKGRFSNIKVSYPAGIAGDTEADFREGISAFRNALASRKGYKRLEDDYNPDEYRMAVYKSGLEVTPKALKAGEFTITFDCKPQRFLKSGETAVTIGGAVTNPQTESGSIVSIEGTGADKVTSLIAQIEPVQAGSGDPSPTNVRPITGWTNADVKVNGKNFTPSNWVAGTLGSTANGVINVSSSTAYRNRDIQLPAGTYTFSSESNHNSFALYIYSWNGTKYVLNESKSKTFVTTGVKTRTIDEGELVGVVIRRSEIAGGDDIANIKFQIELGTTATAYEPYTGHTTPVPLGQTVYGGTVDVVTGLLTVTHKAVDLGTMTWTLSQASGTNYFRSPVLSGAKIAVGGQTSAMCSAYKPISGVSLSYFLSQNNVAWTAPSNISSYNPYAVIRDDRYSDAATFKTAVSGVLLVYELATPQTYNLTAQQVKLLTGQNHVWADTGDITITWGDDPYKVVNPTLFESHPLVRVEGHGELSIGDADITLYSTELGRIDLPAKRTQQSFTYSQYSNNVYDTEVFTTDFLNNGDKFYWNGGQYYFPFSTANIELVNSSSGGFDGRITTPGTYVEPSATPRIDATDWSTTRYYVGAKVLTPVEFTFGTAKTVTDSAVIDVTYKTDNGNTYTRTVTVEMSLTYTGLNNVGLSIRATNSADEAVSYNSADHYFGTAPTFYGISTQTPGDLYIDTDIGEAYFVAGGTTLDANNYVYFKGDLPTLAPGATEVTYSGITAVEITPRWWEV